MFVTILETGEVYSVLSTGDGLFVIDTGAAYSTVTFEEVAAVHVL